MKTIVKMKFGSHLYGTDTPKSDLDYKGIALPSIEQIALGKVPKHLEYYSSGSDKTKNTKDDIDIEVFSLHEFVKLALAGQTVAFDMLHAPSDMLIENSPTWCRIVLNRDKFYSKNIHAFIGYAQGQAAKYGLKGSRLDDSLRVLNFLNSLPPKQRLEAIDLDSFPKGEHIKMMLSDKHNESCIEVCGKKLHMKARNEYNASIIQLFYNAYGERAKLAAKNLGVDFKAISHAFRAAHQVKELFTTGTITFPRPEAEFLKQIKNGELRYLDIAPQLDALIDEVKELQLTTTLSEKPDTEFWNKFLLDLVEEEFACKRFMDTYYDNQTSIEKR